MLRKSALEGVNETDKQNFEGLRRCFKYETAIADDLVFAYELCHRAINPHLVGQASKMAETLICGVCSTKLLIGATALLRLHGDQMFQSVRSAVEAAGIANAIVKDPAKLTVLLEDDGREQQRRAVKEMFKRGKLFPKDGSRLLKLVGGHYDFASARFHVNMPGLVAHFGHGSGPGKIALSVQDISPDRVEADFPLFFFWLCQSHLAILLTIDEIFPTLPATDDMMAFCKEREYIVQKLFRFRTKHKEQLAALEVP